MAECPLCYEKYPMMMIDDHMHHCSKVNRDPNLVQCKVCGAQMDKGDLPDHAIAHTVEQKQIETQAIMRVVEINEFFEEEKLEVGTKEPCMKKGELNELPTKKFVLTEAQKEKDSQLSCRICMQEFEEGENLRTTRCLHMFHRKCIDKWLIERTGACPICKIK